MTTDSTALATDLATATKALETARHIASHPADLNAKEAYRRLLAVYQLGAYYGDTHWVEWNFVMGKTQQWKTVAPWAERVIPTLEAIVGQMTRRLEVRAERQAAEALVTAEPTDEPKRSGRKCAENNPLTYELLALADTAGGLDFAAEARLRGMTYDSVNAPVWYYAKRNGTDLVAAKIPGARGRTYFTRRAWDENHAKALPDVTPVAWPPRKS